MEYEHEDEEGVFGDIEEMKSQPFPASSVAHVVLMIS
jgi:hypothetical protein